MKRRPLNLCLLTLMAASAATVAQEGPNPAAATLAGEWEGSILIDEENSFDVLWRFELSDAGTLAGFMGPAAQDTASIPMQGLRLTGSELRFTIEGQGAYAGEVSETGIHGTWDNDRNVSPLNMTKIEISAVSEEAASRIIGDWAGNLVPEPTMATDIVWRFELTDTGRLVGFMGPAIRGAILPMRDLGVTDTEIRFRIDEQGSYSGQLSDGRITGIWNNESAGEVPLDMVRPEPVAEAVSALAVGDWEGAIGTFGVVWRFEISDEGILNGLMGPEAQGAILPMQNLQVTESEIGFIINRQGAFSGQFSPAGITGIWTAPNGMPMPLEMTRKD